MKIVKAALIVILLIISILLLVGVFVPEVDDEFEVTINRPLMEVYAGMANLQRAPEWVVGLDSVHQTSGFLAMPGSTFKLYYSGEETKVVYTMEVLGMEPLQSVKIKLFNEMFEFDVSVKFKAEGMTTVLNTYVRMKGKSLVTKSFLPLLKTSIMQVGKDNFKALKQLQEQ